MPPGVAELRLEPGEDKPEPPIAVVALDRLVDPILRESAIRPARSRARVGHRVRCPRLDVARRVARLGPTPRSDLLTASWLLTTSRFASNGIACAQISPQAAASAAIPTPEAGFADPVPVRDSDSRLGQPGGGSSHNQAERRESQHAHGSQLPHPFETQAESVGHKHGGERGGRDSGLPGHPPGPLDPDSGAETRTATIKTGRQSPAHRGLPGTGSGRPARSRERARAAPTNSRRSGPVAEDPIGVPLVEGGRPELPATATAPAQQVRPHEASVGRCDVGPGSALKPFTRAAGSEATTPTAASDEGRHDDGPPRRLAETEPALEQVDAEPVEDARAETGEGDKQCRAPSLALDKIGAKGAVHELVTLEEHPDRARPLRPTRLRSRPSGPAPLGEDHEDEAPRQARSQHRRART